MKINLFAIPTLSLASLISFRSPAGEPLVDHFMSGTMAADMDKRRDNLANDDFSGVNNNNFMVPFTYYNDGVSPFDTGRCSIEVGMTTVLTNDPAMQQQSWSKICIGYIKKTITGMTDDELVYNVMKYGNNFHTITAAKRTIKEFINSIYSIFHLNFKRVINYGYAVGIELLVPGHGFRVIRPYFAALIADFPALHGTLSLKNCRCHLCCYNTSDSSDVYCSTVHCPRNFSLQIKHQQTMEQRRRDEGSNIPRSLSEKENGVKAGKFCNIWGLSEQISALVGTVIGTSEDTDLLNTVACRDEFHDLCAGVLTSLIMMSLHTIEAFAKAKGTDIEVLAAVDEATSRKRVLRHPPKMRHLDHTTLAEGLVSQVLRTSTGERNKGTTS